MKKLILFLIATTFKESPAWSASDQSCTPIKREYYAEAIYSYPPIGGEGHFRFEVPFVVELGSKDLDYELHTEYRRMNPRHGCFLIFLKAPHSKMGETIYLKQSEENCSAEVKLPKPPAPDDDEQQSKTQTWTLGFGEYGEGPPLDLKAKIVVTRKCP